MAASRAGICKAWYAPGVTVMVYTNSTRTVATGDAASGKGQACQWTKRPCSKRSTRVRRGSVGAIVDGGEKRNGVVAVGELVRDCNPILLLDNGGMVGTIVLMGEKSLDDASTGTGVGTIGAAMGANVTIEGMTMGLLDHIIFVAPLPFPPPPPCSIGL